MTAPARICADWIAVDWGTTRLRAYALGADNKVLAEAASDAGMSTLDQAGYEPALLQLIDGWLAADRATDVIACGMVGSRQGWIEAPYRALPCPPVDPVGLVPVATGDPRLSVWLVPGLMQTSPADVMRGEEVQIAGAVALMEDFGGVICLPGTHCKWVNLSADNVTGFQTYMTGELFALLSTQSVLRHGIAPTGWDDTAFAEGLTQAASNPERLTARLFSLRAEALLAGLSPVAARARLSGLLIGAEIAAAEPFWAGRDVVLVGSDNTCAPYAKALIARGVSTKTLSAADCTISGLMQLRSHS